MQLYSKKYSDHVAGATGYAGFRNRRRLALLTQRMDVGPEDRVLEIGPNTGLLLDALKGKAASTIGIDINREVVDRLARPDIRCMDAAHMTFSANSFDVVIGIEVFEHIPALDEVFSEIARVLVNGGKCYMTVPFEIFRGQQALGDAWFIYRNLRMARQLHVHKLSPGKIRSMIAHTSLQMKFAKLLWIPGPSYFIVLSNEKQNG